MITSLWRPFWIQHRLDNDYPLLSIIIYRLNDYYFTFPRGAIYILFRSTCQRNSRQRPLKINIFIHTLAWIQRTSHLFITTFRIANQLIILTLNLIPKVNSEIHTFEMLGRKSHRKCFKKLRILSKIKVIHKQMRKKSC